MGAIERWDDLSHPWQVAFDEAWASWCAGSLGIGAALFDPQAGAVVARGRNRTAEPRTEPGVLASNFMAHAEMNTFAVLDRFKADGLHLYTTREPCFMCAATALFMHVEATHFSTLDPYFVDVNDLWDHHEYSARWKREVAGPLPAPMDSVGDVLHLSRMDSGSPGFAIAEKTEPARARLSAAIVADRSLQILANDGASAAEAMALIIERC